jgi:hypothetical protein
MAHDVFLSYSSKDKPTADAASALLEGAGIRCWIAPRDILPGRDWGESIIDAIAASRVMVLIFSDHANHSPQVRREVERAVNKGVVIIPFRIENVPVSKSLEYFISVPHWMDAYSGGPMEAHLARLCQTVKALIRSGEEGPGAIEADARGIESGETSDGSIRPVKRRRTGRKVALGVILAAAVAAGVGVMSGRLSWPLPGRAAATPEGGQPAAARADGHGTTTPANPHSGEPAARPATRPAIAEAAPAPARVTAPPPAAQESVPSRLEADAAALRLTSIALVGRARFCVIDGRSLREGEVARGFTVWQILTDRVVVVRDGRRFELRPQPVVSESNSGPQGRAPTGDEGGPGGGSRFPGGPGADGPPPPRGVDPFEQGYGDGPPLPPPGAGGGPPARRGRGR